MSFANKFVLGRNRSEFEKSLSYDFSQLILGISLKDSCFEEDANVLYRIKEYQTLKNSFNKYLSTNFIQRLDQPMIKGLK